MRRTVVVNHCELHGLAQFTPPPAAALVIPELHVCNPLKRQQHGTLCWSHTVWDNAIQRCAGLLLCQQFQFRLILHTTAGGALAGKGTRRIRNPHVTAEGFIEQFAFPLQHGGPVKTHIDELASYALKQPIVCRVMPIIVDIEIIITKMFIISALGRYAFTFERCYICLC
ncbi:hypothetical protein D3C80_1470740 [compost metagenome]